MERIGGVQILLLEDHCTDGRKVRKYLERLEDLKVIRTVTRKNMVLGFFADEEVEPAAIILFMNCQEAIGVFLCDNHYLLASEKYGVHRLKGKKPIEVSIPGKSTSCLAEFMTSLTRTRTLPNHLFN